MPTPEDIFARGRANGRHTLLTLVVAICFFLSSIAASLQSRHNGPVIIADVGYALAAGVVAGAAAWIYRRAS